MATVVILNLANYAHWIAFPAVAKKAAAYYEVTGDQLDMIPTVRQETKMTKKILYLYV